MQKYPNIIDLGFVPLKNTRPPHQVHAKTIGKMQDNGKYKVYLKDAWVVITLALLLFIIPAENPLRGTWRFKPADGQGNILHS